MTTHILISTLLQLLWVAVVYYAVDTLLADLAAATINLRYAQIKCLEYYMEHQENDDGE